MLAKNISNLVQQVVKIIPNRPTHKIQGCVRLTCADGVLSVTATDLNNFIVKSIACDLSSPEDRDWLLDLAINADLLENFLKACSKLDIELSQSTTDDDVELLHIKSHGMHYKFNALKVDEFPTMETVTDGIKVVGDRAFVQALELAAKMASKDPIKQVLTGVAVRVEAGVATMRSSDGWVMSQQEIPLISGADCEFVINQDLIKLLAKSEGDTLTLEVGEESLISTLGETVIGSRLVAGDFPGFDKIVYPDADEVVADVRSLKAAIKRCAGDKEKGNDTAQLIWVYGDVKNQCLWVEGGKGKEQIPAVVGQNPDASYMTPDLLQNTLAAIKTPKVSLQLGRGGRMTKVSPAGATGITFGLVGRETAVKFPYKYIDGGLEITANMTWKDDAGVLQKMEPAIALPYHYEAGVGLIVDQDLKETYQVPQGWRKEVEFKVAIALPYEYQEGALVVTSAVKKDYWEFTNGTGRWISCEFAPAEPLPEIKQTEQIKENKIMTKPSIWQKVADIRLPLLGNYWNNVYECDRTWLTEELETLQVILLEWLDMGNTADSVRLLFEKLAQDVPKAEICNLLGFQARTDLLVRYTTAQPSYDGFGTL